MSTTATHDAHHTEELETSGGHPLGLDTEDLLEDLAAGWSYIRKGGWIFLVLLALISFVILRNVIHALGTSLPEIFIEGLKLILS